MGPQAKLIAEELEFLRRQSSMGQAGPTPRTDLQPQAIAKESAIDRNIKNIYQSIEELSLQFATFESSLASVLSPIMPEQPREQNYGEASCELAEKLSTINYRIQEIRRKFADLKERIQL